jgi:hypothetical protein
MAHQMSIVFLLVAALVIGMGGFIASATRWAHARAFAKFARGAARMFNRQSGVVFHFHPWRTIWPWSTLFFALMTLVVALMLGGCQMLTERPMADVEAEYSVYQRMGPELLLLAQTHRPLSPQEIYDRGPMMYAWKQRVDAKELASSKAPGDLAERATYKALAPYYLLLSDADPSNDPYLSLEEQARVARTVKTWRLRLEQELKGRKPNGSPGNPIPPP